MGTSRERIIRTLLNKKFPLFAVFLSSILFFLSHPNFIVQNGISVFAWVCYVPVLFSLKKIAPRFSFLYGFSFGFLSYLFLCYWVLKYSVAAGIGVFFLFGCYWGIAFFIIKKCEKSDFYCGIVPAVLFLLEFFSTKGYFGFGYGVSGYTQWNVPLFVAASKYFGVWGITFLILFSNTCFVCLAENKFRFEKKISLRFSVFAAFLLIYSVFGFAARFASSSENSAEKKLNVCLVQNNFEPWKTGFDEYLKEVESLKRLSDEAVEKHPETNLVVWSESSVVVDIIKHSQKNIEPRRHKMAVELLSYFSSKDCAFLIGTNHDGYNCAVLFQNDFENGGLSYQIYKKNHLVPFSEDFPLKNVLNGVYQKKIESGEIYWKKGTDANLFEYSGILIGAPVCFEDSFSEIPGKMKKNGAELLVNLTNDFWADDRACQFLHLACACFRAAENSVPLLRATNSGQTCFIDSTGRVVQMLEPFCKGVLYCEVELNGVE